MPNLHNSTLILIMENILYDHPPLMARCDVWLSGFIYKGAAGVMPIHSRAVDDVQGSTSFAGGMDAGSDWPVCELHSES